MYTYKYKHIITRIHVYTLTFIHMYIHMYIYKYKHIITCIHVYTFICILIYLYIFIYIFINMYVYTCIYIYIYICMYTHICTRGRRSVVLMAHIHTFRPLGRRHLDLKTELCKTCHKRSQQTRRNKYTCKEHYSSYIFQLAYIFIGFNFFEALRHVNRFETDLYILEKSYAKQKRPMKETSLQSSCLSP